MAVPLTRNEQRIAIALAAAAAVFFVLSLRDSTAVLAVGLVMAGALAAAAWRRHRIATAIASFVTGFGPWGFAFILGAPFLILAFVLVRAGRQVPDDQRGARR